ncbi:hypothetical protein [Porphyrobacter sp. AAP60]|uniref:hypothetical protein n=1 Tax=Porphyrobacter sp. AAP60 TaxID=1523423 RepID=UPI0006B984CE|nr:hypothetical protein [Porphyrobacter sp. AAP60]KPF63274.1 hypothetical protein IP79_10315 [Porphyrobacter sp. AAP60]
MAISPELALGLISAHSQALYMEMIRIAGNLDTPSIYVVEHDRTVLLGPFTELVYSGRIAKERN